MLPKTDDIAEEFPPPEPVNVGSVVRTTKAHSAAPDTRIRQAHIVQLIFQRSHITVVADKPTQRRETPNRLYLGEGATNYDALVSGLLTAFAMPDSELIFCYTCNVTGSADLDFYYLGRKAEAGT